MNNYSKLAAVLTWVLTVPIFGQNKLVWEIENVSGNCSFILSANGEPLSALMPRDVLFWKGYPLKQSNSVSISVKKGAPEDYKKLFKIGVSAGGQFTQIEPQKLQFRPLQNTVEFELNGLDASLRGQRDRFQEWNNQIEAMALVWLDQFLSDLEKRDETLTKTSFDSDSSEDEQLNSWIKFISSKPLKTVHRAKRDSLLIVRGRSLCVMTGKEAQPLFIAANSDGSVKLRIPAVCFSLIDGKLNVRATTDNWTTAVLK